MIARDGALDFDAMQTRLHPAESRIRRLSAEIPAEYVAFDMLCGTASPCGSCRSRSAVRGSRRCRGLPRLARDAAVDEARGWLERFEALGLDGVVAKRWSRTCPARARGWRR